MDNNKSFTVEDIQQHLLELLLYFNKFCNEHNLKFVLAGGTCLGAARHKGFIPWDDDLDVFMLREDYEKFYELWNEYADTDRFEMVRTNEKVNVHHSAIEIQDKQTTFVLSRNLDLDSHQGLMIDVIPLDGVAPGKFGKMLQMMNSMIYCCFNFQRMPAHKGKMTATATKIALNLIRSPKMRYKLWSKADKRVRKYGTENSEFVASFGEGATIMRRHFPTDWFKNPAFLEFEGHQMPVPREYDKWLTRTYGNYMQLPPEKDRVFRHEAVFIDLDTSYEEYKGIYYGKDRTHK